VGVEYRLQRQRFNMNASLTHAASVFPSSSAAYAASSTQASTKPLWAVVGILSVCVMAMGATLVHVKHRPAEPLAQAALPFGSALASDFSSDGAAEPASGKGTQKASASTPPTPTRPTMVTAAKAPKAPVENAASTAPTAPVAVAQSQTKASCDNCGTVESVTPFTRQGQASGVGVIAGGVLGGVLGNQVGKGNGRAATTVLGAIGGGWAGNTIEKNMKKTTAYSVRVRMQDGSSRVIEQSSSPMVGGKVTVDGNVLRPA
jgi:outer membrane lipoprotein SlyB